MMLFLASLFEAIAFLFYVKDLIIWAWGASQNVLISWPALNLIIWIGEVMKNLVCVMFKVSFQKDCADGEIYKSYRSSAPMSYLMQLILDRSNSKKKEQIPYHGVILSIA